MNKIFFLNENELLDILLSDKDHYYKTFYSLDLKVRNVESIKEYKENIKKSVCPTHGELYNYDNFKVRMKNNRKSSQNNIRNRIL